MGLEKFCLKCVIRVYMNALFLDKWGIIPQETSRHLKSVENQSWKRLLGFLKGHFIFCGENPGETEDQNR